MAAIQMNREEFERATAGGIPVLVNFCAPWCSCCRRIERIYDWLSGKYAGRLITARVNIDEEQALAVQEEIEVIPTLVLYWRQEAMGSIVAPESRAQIEALIAESVQKCEAQR